MAPPTITPASVISSPAAHREDPVEPSLGRHGCRSVGRPHLVDRERVRALVLANVAEEGVRPRIARRRPIAVVDLVDLGGLAGCEQPVDRCEPGLEAKPGREPNRALIGYLDSQLSHSRLEPAAVAAFCLGHLAQDLRPLGLALPLGDQLGDGAGLDLSAPGLQQAIGRPAHRPIVTRYF